MHGHGSECRASEVVKAKVPSQKQRQCRASGVPSQCPQCLPDISRAFQSAVSFVITSQEKKKKKEHTREAIEARSYGLQRKSKEKQRRDTSTTRSLGPKEGNRKQPVPMLLRVGTKWRETDQDQGSLEVKIKKR